MLSRIIFSIVASLLIGNECSSQTRAKEIECQKVLSKSIIQKTFVFDNSNVEYPYVKDHVTFLGTLISEKGEKFKIIKWTTLWGPNRHTINFVYIYNSKNNYLGKFKYLLRDELPIKIEKNKLVYYNVFENGDVDKTKYRHFSFLKGLPERICINCKSGDERGALFSKEE